MQAWLKDMNSLQVQYDDKLLEKLNSSVQEQLDMYDPRTVEQQRAELLVKLLKDKEGASMLA